MKRVIFLMLLLSLFSCAKEELSTKKLFTFSNPPNSISKEHLALTPDLQVIEIQFKNNLEALIKLHIEAIKLGKEANLIVVPENPSELELTEIFSILTTEGFINPIELSQLTSTTNSDFQTLSGYLSPGELEGIIQNYALNAIGFTPLEGAHVLPCYDDYEANTIGLTIGYAGCLVFSGGIPGGAVCTMLYAAGVLVIEEQFENCLRNTYPNGSTGN